MTSTASTSSASSCGTRCSLMGLTTSDSHLCFFLLICRQNSVVRQGKLSYIPRLANDNQLGDIILHTLCTRSIYSYAASSCGETTGRRPASLFFLLEAFSKGEGPLRLMMKRPRANPPMRPVPDQNKRVPRHSRRGRGAVPVGIFIDCGGESFSEFVFFSDREPFIVARSLARQSVSQSVSHVGVIAHDPCFHSC